MVVRSSSVPVCELRALPTPAAAVEHNWAVVSFQLEDAVWCDWIFREFDGQRVPRALQGKPSRFGTPYPDRLSVTPDPADPTQLENYAEALRSAQHLILVVSPASGRSPVLQEHLRTFKANGGEERVIALVVKGEPASPSSSPGSAADRDWLPKWLEWRFKENQFESAPASEPIVVDARMGKASLAEVRSQLLASLLEVRREELNELGVVNRPNTNLLEFPTAASLHDVPSPTPSTAAFVEIASAPSIEPNHARWPIYLSGFAAVLGLFALAAWPDENDRQKRSDLIPIADTNGPADLPKDFILAEARPIADAAWETFLPPSVAVAPLKAAPTPATTVELQERDRQQIVARRDRLIRLAEQRMGAGDSSEALETLLDALAVARELAGAEGSIPSAVVEYGLLTRRAATLSQALLRLQAGGGLQRDGLTLLGELETALRRTSQL
jgi:hypothetical protein